jgi:hypothetical protein
MTDTSDFLKSRDMPAADTTYGLEFESEGVRVQVVAHPQQPDRLIVDAVVAALEPDPGIQLPQLLLEFNGEARFERYLNSKASWWIRRGPCSNSFSPETRVSRRPAGPQKNSSDDLT